MKKASNHDASTEKLVERFQSVALAQYDAAWTLQITRYNRFYKEMSEIRIELKSRGGRRRALMPLLEASNVQVRLMAANTLLAILPDLARKALESARDYGQLPQAADASGMLEAIDNGSFVPS